MFKNSCKNFRSHFASLENDDSSNSLDVVIVRDEKEASIDDILSKIGFGKVHWWLLITCGLFLMGATCELMGLSVISSAISCEFLLNYSQRSALNGAGFIGMICSAYFWICGCDTYGRRKVLLCSVLISSPLSLISMLMPEYYSFLAFRFLVGIFVAGSNLVTTSYFTEFCPRGHIAFAANCIAMFRGFSMLYNPTIASRILKLSFEIEFWIWTFRSWRLFGLMLSLPGLIAVILLIKLPESPKYLVIKSDNECQKVLEWLCKTNTGKSLRDINLGKATTDSPSINTTKKSMFDNKVCTSSWTLCQWFYMRRMLPVCILLFGLFFIANGMGLWFTEFRNRTRNHCGKNTNICCSVGVITTCQKVELIDTIVLAGSYITLFILIGVLLLFTTRRIAFTISLCIATVFGYSVLLLTRETLNFVAITLFLSINGVMTNLLGSSIIEFVPTILRARATATLFVVGNAGAVVGTTMLGLFFHNYCFIAFFILASFSLTSAILSASGIIFP